MKPVASVFVLFAFAWAVDGGEAISLSSPNQNIALKISAASSNDTGLGFKISFQGNVRVTGQLGLSIGGTNIFAGAVQKKSQSRESDSTYTVLFGKRNPVRDQFNELIVNMETGQGPVRDFQVVFRAYDDGIAFRYLIPIQQGSRSVEVTEEPTIFQLPGKLRLWPLYRENYTTSHEGLYAETTLSELGTNQLIDLPLLAQFEDGAAIAFSEANLRNYAGMYLKAERRDTSAVLRCDLSPLPGQKAVKVHLRLPLSSPWRVVLIGEQPGRLIESNLILNLNDPSVIGDASWLKFGKTTWYWWNGPYQEPVDFKVGLNWETMKHYIDFCASNSITFHSIMSTPDDYPWYYQTQRGFGPGVDSDVTKARPGFEMERVAEYARAKGVGLRLWVHWKPLNERLEEAFTQYQKWGINGLMVDFLDRDDQEMVNWAEKVLESAARHHLHIHFHGVWKPTGLQRTYPNLFNHEGVLNLEYLKWGNECSPPHNVTVPFTRMLAGPLDYHLGGFRAVNREQFKPVSMKPIVLGTRCHHLAMYVVFENPMPMVSDAPTAYEGQPGFDFIRQVPTAWDETRVLSGEVGHYIVVARRKGNDWYIGAMTDWSNRDVKVPLKFLSAGQYNLQVWSDALESEDPNKLTFEKRTAEAKDELLVKMKSGGGQVIRSRPQN